MANARNMTNKLVSLLESGKELTSAQITRRVGLQNPSSTIDRLRTQGYKINSLKVSTKKGVEHRYSMI